jgi:hypothetical protein
LALIIIKRKKRHIIEVTVVPHSALGNSGRSRCESTIIASDNHRTKRKTFWRKGFCSNIKYSCIELIKIKQ